MCLKVVRTNGQLYPAGDGRSLVERGEVRNDTVDREEIDEILACIPPEYCRVSTTRCRDPRLIVTEAVAALVMIQIVEFRSSGVGSALVESRAEHHSRLGKHTLLRNEFNNQQYTVSLKHCGRGT